MPRAPNRSVGLNPVRMGLSDRARRRWKYAALALAAYLLARAALGPWLHANKLGGPWYIVEESRWFPEAEFAKYTLYRRGGPRLIKIDRSLSQFRYYPPDCVIYDGYRRPVEHALFSRCAGGGSLLRSTAMPGGRLVHACRSDERARRQGRAPVATMAHAHSRDSSRRPNPASVPRRMGAGAA